jgi:outer membrane protein assembly factor BamD (BamD/ComL family)
MKNRFLPIFLILLAICLLGFSIYKRLNGTDLFYSISTGSYEALPLIQNYAHQDKVLIANFKFFFTLFSQNYLFTAFVLLLPAIVLASVGLSRLQKNKNKSHKNIYTEKLALKLLAALILISFIAVTIVHFTVLHNYPLVSDERSYLFQGDLLRAGKLYAEAPPLPQFFNFDSIVCRDKWHSKYTISWPLLLGIAGIFKAEWIAGSLSAAFTIFFLYLITRKIFGIRAGLISVVFALFSPMFILMGASYFPHTALGLLMLIIIYCTMNLEKDNKFLYTISIGVSLILAVNMRPADGLLIFLGLIPLAGYIYYKSSNKKYVKRGLLVIPIFLAIGLGIIMLVNYIQTGNPFLLSYSKFNPKDTWGFGVYGHNLINAIWNSAYSFMRTSFWITPFIFTLSLFAFSRKKPVVIFLTIFIILFCVFNMGMFSIGMVSFGTRFYYAPYVISLILASGGLIHISTFIQKKKLFSGRIFIGVFILGVILYTLFGVHCKLYPSIEKKYSESVSMMHKSLNPPQIKEKSILFILNTPKVDCVEYIMNKWNLDDQKIITVQFLLPEENRQLMNYYKDRKPYLEYWDMNEKKFVIIPYPQQDETPKFLLYAGINYASLLIPEYKKRAEIAFKRALALAPDNFSIMHNISSYYLANGNPEKATETFRHLIRNYPATPEIYFYMGISLHKQGKDSETIEAFSRLLKDFPDSAYTDKAMDWLLFFKEQGKM